MTKRERIESDAYMILQELAFGFTGGNTDTRVVVINLKNTEQVASFRVRDKDLLFCESNMSKENTYKAMLIVERNKARLIEGMKKWVSTQDKK